jgi:DNA-binding CsgD family transcriptional regulator/tetratricopeptide (TPR) repeat protein
VGRDVERALLSAHLETARRSGSIVTVGGEPGIGKTRLAGDVAAALGAAGHRVLILRCYEETQTLPYGPFREAAGELAEIPALLADIPATSEGARTEAGARLGPFDRVDKLLQQWTTERPLLVVIDDLQWADAASIELVRHLVRRGRGRHRAFLASLRPRECSPGSALDLFLADTARERSRADLPLLALTEAFSQELVRAVLERAEPEVGRTLHGRTGGVPLFMEEQLRLLLLNGHLRREQGTWRLTEAAARGEVPLSPTIATTIQRRVGQLPMDAQELLQAASVLGTRVPLPLLADLCARAAPAVVEDLAPAVRARLLHPVYAAGSDLPDAYVFGHVLTRDTLYVELAPDRRRALHARVARILGGKGSGAIAPAAEHPSEAIAYHAERAHEWRLAYDASVIAGAAAIRALASGDALVHLRRARHLLPSITTSPADRLELERLTIVALLGAGRLADVGVAAQALTTLAAELGDRATETWAWIRLGQVKTFEHHLDEAAAALDQGERLAEAQADPALLAGALSERAVLLHKRGLLAEADACLLRALPLAEQAGNRIVVLNGAIYLGHAQNWQGRFGDAVTHLQEALLLAQAARDTLSIANARFALGLARAGLGQYEAALAELRALMELSEVIGQTYFAARIPNTIGWIHRELLLVDSAVDWDSRSIVETEQGDGPGIAEARANSLLNLAMDVVLLGRLDEAGDVLRDATQPIERDEFMRWRNRNRFALTAGELLLARGDAAGALAAAEDAIGQAQRISSAKYVALAHDLAARALTVLGRNSTAISRFELAVSGAAGLGYIAGQWRALARLAHLLARSGQPDAAAARTGEAQAIVDRIAAGLRAPELRASRLVAEPVAVLVADAVPGVGGSGRLSVRETEVLRLVARGFTNQRIASELSISERTVNSHLVHIFNKLGVDNRVAAAMHAVRAGLADQAS